MEHDPKQVYQMPLIMGPLHDRRTRFLYREMESFVLQYQTDPESIPALLPDCYQPAKDATVTVLFTTNRGLDFMAGGGYSIASIQVSAVFAGPQEKIEGDYILVMGEDDTVPIIGGREKLGVPKIFMDIANNKMLADGKIRCQASQWGHLLFGIDLAPMKKQNVLVRTIAAKRVSRRPWLGYKYIPALDGPPDAAYPTLTRNDIKIDQMWMGKDGELFFGDAGENDIGSTKCLIDALKTLPVVKVLQTVHMRGSAVLRFDLSRRLD